MQRARKALEKAMPQAMAKLKFFYKTMLGDQTYEVKLHNLQTKKFETASPAVMEAEKYL
jgi:hypothetical protein